MDHSFSKLTSVLSKILEIDTGSINLNSSPENIESWDSYNGLAIVSALEQEFHVEFKIEEIIAVKNVKDIVNCLYTHGISFNDLKL